MNIVLNKSKLRKTFIGVAAVASLTLSTALSGAVFAATPDNTLVIANSIASMTSLDPAEVFDLEGADYLFNVYDTLITFDPENLGPIVPGIAESWTVSEDGKSFIFKIREGAKFHSGNPVTAKDVEYSVLRAANLKKTPVFILKGIGISDENVSEVVKATGDMEVTITLEKAYAPSYVLNIFSTGVFSIVDMKLLQEHEVDGDYGYEWLRTKSAGSGAYKLNRWEANVSYSLDANQNYWRAKPKLEKVFVRHSQENSVKRLLLEKGDVDIARSLTPEEIDGLKSNPDIAITTDLASRITYLGLSQKNKYLSKPKVAEALKYLVDYKGMVNSFLRGQYTIRQSFVPKTILGAIDENPFTFDVAKAKELLAEAGYPDGFNVTMHVRNESIPTVIAQSLQNTWGQAGVKVEIISGTGAQVIAPYRARKHDIYLGGWGAIYPDPHATAGTFANNPDNSDEANITGSLAWRNSWDIPEFTAITDAALEEVDYEKRLKMYQDLQREHQKVSPFVVMFQESVQTALRKEVKGFVTGSAVTKAFYWTVSK